MRGTTWLTFSGRSKGSKIGPLETRMATGFQIDYLLARHSSFQEPPHCLGSRLTANPRSAEDF